MEQKSKKVKNTFSFENDLFNQNDINSIKEKIEKNITILLTNENYIDIDDKLLDLNVQLNSSLTKDQLEIFKKYIITSLEANSYQNCLAYYLGIQYGTNISELK